MLFRKLNLKPSIKKLSNHHHDFVYSICKELIMDKTALNGISYVLPFDGQYIKVGKGVKNTKWNLMDGNGALISENWFASIVHNASDNSIVAEIIKPKTAPVKATFLNTAAIVKCVKIMDKIPPSIINFVDSGSIELYNSNAYVAKATLYGMEVYIAKNGEVYNKLGDKCRLLFNTVDSERLCNAIRAFNRKMNYDYSAWEDNTYKTVRQTKTALWGFYFVTDNWHVCTTFEPIHISDNTKKWTDDLILRMCEENTPESVKKAFISEFGEGDVKTQNMGEGNPPLVHRSWHFAKTDLEKIITFLNKF